MYPSDLEVFEEAAGNICQSQNVLVRCHSLRQPTGIPTKHWAADHVGWMAASAKLIMDRVVVGDKTERSEGVGVGDEDEGEEKNSSRIAQFVVMKFDFP